MLLELELKSCSRLCAATEQALEPGDVYFSVLQEQDTEILRQDYSAGGWQGPPEDCLGWWRSRMPTKDDSKPRLAPREVMLNLFAALAEKPREQDFRYMLGLLLLRRRVLRTEETKQDEQGRPQLVLRCPRRDEQFDLTITELDAKRSAQVQQRMIELLYRDGDDTQP